MNSPPPETAPGPSSNGPRIIVGISVLVIVAGLMVLAGYVYTVRSGVDATEAVAESITGIADRFRTGTITTSFVSSLPSARSAGSGNLEVATLESVESFRRSDELRVFWNRINLGETVSEIRVPVTYRYYVSLDGPWSIETEGQTCLVLAPPLEAFLPPAIHTEGLERRSDPGWMRFNAAAQMEELEREITRMLSEYATDPAHLDLAREPARRTVAGFVRQWLLDEDHWREDRFHTIVVRFAGESHAEVSGLAPTLQLAE